MPPVLVPGTDKVIFMNPNTGDLVVDLSDYGDIDDTLKNEDIVVIGDFEDYSGSGTKGPSEVMLQGLADELAADLYAKADGAKFDEVTNRGNIAATHRQRHKLVYMEGINA